MFRLVAFASKDGWFREGAEGRGGGEGGEGKEGREGRGGRGGRGRKGRGLEFRATPTKP